MILSKHNLINNDVRFSLNGLTVNSTWLTFEVSPAHTNFLNKELKRVTKRITTINQDLKWQNMRYIMHIDSDRLNERLNQEINFLKLAIEQKMVLEILLDRPNCQLFKMYESVG